MPPKGDAKARGRLKSAGPNISGLKYKCVVKDCNLIVRGDRIKEHFQKKSKLDVLDEAKKMDVSGEITNGLKHIDSMVIDDENQRNHTKYLLSNGYSSNKLPNMKTEDFRKRPNISLPNAFSNAGFKATSSKVCNMKLIWHLICTPKIDFLNFVTKRSESCVW